VQKSALTAYSKYFSNSMGVCVRERGMEKRGPSSMSEVSTKARNLFTGIKTVEVGGRMMKQATLNINDSCLPSYQHWIVISYGDRGSFIWRSFL